MYKLKLTLLIIFIQYLHPSSPRALPHHKLGSHDVVVEDTKEDTKPDDTKEDTKPDMDLPPTIIEVNEEVKAHIDRDVTDFEELKARIYLLEMHLKQISQNNAVEENKDFVEDTDQKLKQIDYEVIEPLEEKLRNLKAQVKIHNLELDAEYRNAANAEVETSETLFRKSNDALKVLEAEVAAVWGKISKSEVTETVLEEDPQNAGQKMSDNVGNDDARKAKGLNPYEDWAKKSLEKRIKEHKAEEELVDITSELNEPSAYIDISHPYLIPGMTMLVFLLLCSGLVYKLARRKKAAGRVLSQVCHLLCIW